VIGNYKAKRFVTHDIILFLIHA
ncbi:MAG: hypothetical protein JWL77_1468, partial [Chthonomonadaceae bacterium]|nr:hypothetical protein [Chthonomonadaceae bacterium]